MKKYYVYTLSSNNIIFYVGKGTKDRMYIHEKRAIKGIKSNNNSFLYETILKTVDSGESIEYNKIMETDNELEAYRVERDTISSIGLENLCNLVIDNFTSTLSDKVKLGLGRSDKFKKSIEYKRSDEGREFYKMINTGVLNPRFGKTNTEDHMNSIKGSLIGIPKTEEHRKKIGDAIRGIERTQSHRDNLSHSILNSEKFHEKVQSDEFKQKHRENTKRRHDETITYIFEHNGSKIEHSGGLKNMCKNYDITYYYLKMLRYGEILEHNGWKFIELLITKSNG